MDIADDDDDDDDDGVEKNEEDKNGSGISHTRFLVCRSHKPKDNSFH